MTRTKHVPSRTFARLVLLMLLGYAVGGPLAVYASDDEVRQAEAEWVRALTGGDIAALEAMFSDDLLYVHSSGSIDTKERFLNSIRTGSLRFKSVTSRQMRVRSYGDVGVVNGLYDLVLESRNGTVTPMSIQYLNVYVKDNGRWRIVTQQTTRLPVRK